LDIMSDARLDRKKVVLTDGTVTLRPSRMSDAKEAYQAIKESAAEMSPWLPFVHPDYSLAENRAWLKQRPAEWKKGISYQFVIIDARDGRIIGGCGLNEMDNMNRRCNLGYWVRSDRTGQGIAVAATRLLAKWGFAVLKLNRIEILVAVNNHRSLRVAEKAGAKREGILRNRIVLNDKPNDAVMHSLIPGDV
jgi:ribosomal-protein-serine acetyltransferase